MSDASLDNSLDGGFEPHRRHLLGLAYRMLGSLSDAEDAVQEAWLRWREADRSAVENPRAYLGQTVTRLCLDRLKSARAQREVYVGPWLPAPLVEDHTSSSSNPEAASELASDLSYAFMLTLERLSPLERAAFLLHDVFDADFSEVASTLGRSEAACRQLASRARNRVRDSRPRFRVTREHSQRLVAAFLFTAKTGDAEGLKGLLSEDACYLSDGGGRVAAAGIPILGRARVIKVVLGLAAKHAPPADAQLHLLQINGQPGCVFRRADGTPIQTIALELDEAGLIGAIYVVRNPDKLSHLAGRGRGRH
ncbi:MAG: sigma-70 family RNA polymerase sigma factor [Panacagrimonas sp.]